MKIQPHITILVCAVLFTVLSSTSCRDKKPQPTNDYCMMYPQQCEMPVEAKQYFSFKVGSWWVYEEATSHARDSVYVTEHSDDPNSANFLTKVYSTQQAYFYVYYPSFATSANCHDFGISSGRCIFIRRAKTKPGDYVGEDICFFIQSKKGDQIPITNVQYPNDKLSVADIHFDSFNLGTFNFNRTVKMYEDHTFIENNNATYHYFAKGVGLIRKELLDSNEVWNLVNYHIQE